MIHCALQVIKTAAEDWMESMLSRLPKIITINVTEMTNDLDMIHHVCDEY